MKLDDTELLIAYQRDADERAFAQLVERHGQWIFAAAGLAVSVVVSCDAFYVCSFAAIAQATGATREKHDADAEM